MKFHINQPVKVPRKSRNIRYYFGGTVEEDIYITTKEGSRLLASKGEAIIKKEPTSDSSYEYAPMSYLIEA